MSKSKSDDNKNKVVNMYNRIPKSLLDIADNPNYDLHKLKIPFRAVVVAPSGSGKTNLVVNLIALFSSGKKGTFASITILTKCKEEPLYKFLELKSPSIIIKEGLHNLPKLDDFDKSANHLVILDDLVLAKDQSGICEYYIRCRKKNVSVMYLSQSFYKIPKIIRSNSNYLFILKIGGKRDLNLILSEMSLSTSKETLLKMYDYATKEKFNFLLVDVDESEENRFRHNFLEIMSPVDFQ
jgi:DNA helicase HerA-like ATPase